MSYFIKPVLWAGLGLATVGAGVSTLSTSGSKDATKETATEQLKEAERAPAPTAAPAPATAPVVVEENRTDGHYEMQVVNETRYDSRGIPYVVQVQRRVWVDDVVVAAPTYYYSTPAPYYYSAPYYTTPYYYSGPYYSSGPSFSFRFGGGHHHH